MLVQTGCGNRWPECLKMVEKVLREPGKWSSNGISEGV